MTASVLNQCNNTQQIKNVGQIIQHGLKSRLSKRTPFVFYKVKADTSLTFTSICKDLLIVFLQ